MDITKAYRQRRVAMIKSRTRPIGKGKGREVKLSKRKEIIKEWKQEINK